MAHIMAKAVIEIFGKESVQLAIGPQIADGCYYDFLLPRAVTADDYKTIENKMREIIKRREDWTCLELSRADALELFRDQKYKTEIIEIARKIDTFDTSVLPYEDCCTVFTPKHPKVRPVLADVEKAQNSFDFEPLIQKAVEGTEMKTFNY